MDQDKQEAEKTWFSYDIFCSGTRSQQQQLMLCYGPDCVQAAHGLRLCLSQEVVNELVSQTRDKDCKVEGPLSSK